MAICELSGKKPIVKNLVSHSNVKTKTQVLPNVQQKKLYSSILKEFISLKLATSTIRSVEHVGGLDKFILNQDPQVLSARAAKILNRIKNKIKG